MPAGPPDDRDPDWDDLIAQVREAMRGAGLRPDDEDAVEEGLRAALDQLGELSGLVGVVADDETADGPGVEVVEGGRGLDEPPTPRAGPNLKLAGEVDEDGDTPDTSSPNTSVRVMRIQGGRPSRSAGAGLPGAISLEAGRQQTVFHGARPRPYRITCTRGALAVAVEGLPVEVVLADQSLDVEATLIRVSTDVPEGADGRYMRLR